MKTPRCLPTLATAATALGLISCGSTMNAVRDATAATQTKVSGLSKFSLSDLRPAKVPVVEIRENDLKELTTGHERALAYESKRKRSFWFAGGPVDFKEPSLPEDGAGLDGGLLPPKLE